MKANEFSYYRQRFNLTQEDLAEMLDLTTRTLSTYENGRKPVPKYLQYALRYLASEGQVAILRLQRFRKYRKEVLGK